MLISGTQAIETPSMTLSVDLREIFGHRLEMVIDPYSHGSFHDIVLEVRGG
jgi:hypothetical protein